MVTLAFARRLHYRQNVNIWTKIGHSYFKVFDFPTDWQTAKSNCENVDGTVKINDEKVDAAVSHLAYDKTDELHDFLMAALEDNPEKNIWLDTDSEGKCMELGPSTFIKGDDCTVKQRYACQIEF